MGNSKRPSAQRLTAENRAVQRNNAAVALHAEGKYDAAIREYTQSIQLNPKFTLAWYNRGQVYLLAGRLEEALGDFDSAVRLAPHFLDAIAARGHIRLLLQQHDRGLADLETVMALDRTNVAALVTRAEYWHRRGDCEKANADWGAAITIKPARGDLYRNRGLLHYFQREYDRAVSDHSEAIRLDPADAVAWNNRGAAYLKRGNFAQAAADLGESIRLDPKLPNAYRHLAWLQASCPDPQYRDGDEAVANATRALELTDWKQGEWLEVLAAAHAEAGNFDEAVRWQQKCLDDSPPERKAELQVRLELYERGQRLRVSPAVGASSPADGATAHLVGQSSIGTVVTIGH